MINSMKSIYLVNKFVHDILPKVDKEIYYWENFVRLSISGELKIQALASLKDKKFHGQGGSFYSMLPDVDINNFVKFAINIPIQKPIRPCKFNKYIDTGT